MHFPPTVKTFVFFARVGLGAPLVTYVYRGGATYYIAALNELKRVSQLSGAS